MIRQEIISKNLQKDVKSFPEIPNAGGSVAQRTTSSSMFVCSTPSRWTSAAHRGIQVFAGMVCASPSKLRRTEDFLADGDVRVSNSGLNDVFWFWRQLWRARFDWGKRERKHWQRRRCAWRRSWSPWPRSPMMHQGSWSASARTCWRKRSKCGFSSPTLLFSQMWLIKILLGLIPRR